MTLLVPRFVANSVLQDGNSYGDLWLERLKTNLGTLLPNWIIRRGLC